MNTTFSIGNVLATGFRIWTRNFLPFMVMTALIYSPVIIWNVVAIQDEMTAERLHHLRMVTGYSSLLYVFLNTLLSAALTYGVVMELQGKRASVGACVATGMARFFPALAAGLLGYLCATGALVLLIIPGIIVYCMFYVATQAAVLERPGVIGALKRSRELTAGHKWEIFGLVLILVLLSIALQLVVAAVVGSLSTYATRENYVRHVVSSIVEQMIAGSLSAVMASVAYYFLRAEKEGTSAAELAAIFD